jgi:hypothetical protein
MSIFVVYEAMGAMKLIYCDCIPIPAILWVMGVNRLKDCCYNKDFAMYSVTIEFPLKNYGHISGL